MELYQKPGWCPCRSACAMASRQRQRETRANPHFYWYAVSGATDYWLKVDNNSDFLSPELNLFVGNVTDYTSATALAPGAYYWKMYAHNACGDSPWSDVWQFTVLAELTPTATRTSTATPSVTATATTGNTPTMTATPTRTLTPTNGPSPTTTATPTWTLTPTNGPRQPPSPPPRPPLPRPAERRPHDGHHALHPGQQRIALRQGWNWFSFHIQPSAPGGDCSDLNMTPYFAQYSAQSPWTAGPRRGDAHRAIDRAPARRLRDPGGAGFYPYTRAYGQDADAGIPGLHPGEAITFKVNGSRRRRRRRPCSGNPITATTRPIWSRSRSLAWARRWPPSPASITWC